MASTTLTMKVTLPPITPQTPPLILPSQRPSVQVRHPAYNDTTDILLRFASVDEGTTAQNKTEFGVYFRTVCTACAIITNNTNNSWLATDAKGDNKVELEDVQILPGGDYYLHVPTVLPADAPPDAASRPLPSLTTGGAFAYPVVPTFRHWCFPERMPESFALSIIEPTYSSYTSTYQAIRERDVSCRLTAEGDGVERAHIIPATEQEWFNANGMAVYASNTSHGQDVLDSASNAILLRADVHFLFDKMLFSFVPKPSSYHAGRSVLTTHVTAGNNGSIYKKYHNQQLQPIRGVPPEYFFARFAWDIFPQLRFFLQGRQARKLAIRQEDGNVQVRTFSGEDCAVICKGQGPGRSVSPRKRKTGSESAERAQDNAWTEEGEDTLLRACHYPDRLTASFDSGINLPRRYTHVSTSLWSESEGYESAGSEPLSKRDGDEFERTDHEELLEQDRRIAKRRREADEVDAWQDGRSRSTSRGRKKSRETCI